MVGGIGRLGRESLAYALGGVFSRAVNLLLLPVYTAALPPREYGVLGILLLLAAVVVPVASLGLGVSLGIVYFDRQDKVGRARIVWTAALLTLLTAASILTFALGVPEAISEQLFDSADYSHAVTLTLLIAAASALSLPLMLGVQFQRLVSRYVWISVLTAVLGGGLGLVLVGVFGRGLVGVLEAQLASQLLLLILTFREAWRAGRPQVDWSGLLELLRRGLPLVPSFFFLLVLLQGNQFLLKEFRGLEELGIYMVGYNLGLAMGLVVSGFTMAWMPFFLSFSQNPSVGLALLSRALTYYVIVLGSVTLLFFAWSRPLVGLLTASGYEGAYVVVGFCAAAYFLVGAFSVLLPPLYYAKRVWVVTLIQGIGAIIAVCIQAGLIIQFGIIGAAIGLTCGFFLVCILLLAWFRIFRSAYVFIQYDWIRVLIFGLVLAVGAGLFSWPIQLTWLGEIAWAVTGSMVVIAFLWFALRSDERRTVATMIRGAVSY